MLVIQFRLNVLDIARDQSPLHLGISRYMYSGVGGCLDDRMGIAAVYAHFKKITVGTEINAA